MAAKHVLDPGDSESNHPAKKVQTGFREHDVGLVIIILTDVIQNFSSSSSFIHSAYIHATATTTTAFMMIITRK